MARLRRLLMVAAFGIGLGGALGVLWLDARVKGYLAGPPLGSARVYAAPTVVRVGEAEPEGSLERRLRRLGYRAVDEAPATPGSFRAGPAGVDLVQRPSPAPWAGRPRRARVTRRAGHIVDIRDDTGEPLGRLEFVPEVLAVLSGARATLGTGSVDAPAVCRHAVLAAEDRHFFRHPGVDPLAVGRALWTNVRAGAARQGGSTITQQLVKNALLTPRRTLARKAQEAVLAVLLELRTTKEKILRRYLGSVYLGVDGSLPVHGFAQAAEVYFGRSLEELGPAECALLAGIIRAPNGLAPRRHPEAARRRRDQVLRLMARSAFLDPAAAAQAAGSPLGLAPAQKRPVGALYVAAEVGRELRRLVPREVARAPGLAIFTGIDAHAQREAERAVRRRLEDIERGRRGRDRLQAALVALDPATGQLRALVGGRDFGSSPLDRAIHTRRQPGSAFKPFVYLAAVDPARAGPGTPRTVVSLVEDAPLAVRVGARVWRPGNHDGVFVGTLPLEDALAESRNTATVRLALDVGIDAVVRAAQDLGIASPLPRVPALALGAAETSLLEITSAYAVLASGGVRRAPSLVLAVISGGGEAVYTAAPAEERVLAPGVAYLVTHMLERVVDTGTGRGARAAGLRGAAAGKTGTTDGTRDAWFVGYTPALAAGVWVGLDGGGSTGLSGAQGALPIWTDFLRATAGEPVAEFPVPGDVVWRDVDALSGGLVTSACPAYRREPFVTGTEPREPCPLHRPLWTRVGDGVADTGRALGSGGRRLRGWFSRLFR
jgi:penicillin-binding protein 1B